RAETRLNECPTELRGWEWHYLKRLCHSEVLKFPGNGVFLEHLAYSPDGTLLAGASAHYSGDRLVGEVRLWHAGTGATVRVLKAPPDLVGRLAFSPDGKRLATAGADKAVRLWDVESGKEAATWTGHTDRVTGLVFSPDGSTLVSAADDSTVLLWDVAT